MMPHTAPAPATGPQNLGTIDPMSPPQPRTRVPAAHRADARFRRTQRGVTTLEYVVLAAVLVLGGVAAVSVFRGQVADSLSTEGDAVGQVARGDIAPVRDRYGESSGALGSVSSGLAGAPAEQMPEDRVLAASNDLGGAPPGGEMDPPPMAELAPLPVAPVAAAPRSPARPQAEPAAEIIIYRQSTTSSTQVIVKEGGKILGGYYGNTAANGARDPATSLFASDYQGGTQGPVSDGDYWLKPKDNFDPEKDLLVDKVPSLTKPGLKPGQVSVGSPPVFRMHPNGNSRGCQTAPREWALRIWDLMDKHQDDGGVRVRIVTQKTPHAIPATEPSRKPTQRPFFTSEQRAAAKKPAATEPKKKKGWFR